MAQFELAQSSQLPGGLSSAPRFQTAAPKTGAGFNNQFEPEPEEKFFSQEEFELPNWPEEIEQSATPKRTKQVSRSTASKKTDDPLNGLKKRSLNKSKRLNMPPTPNGHDWHVTDGGWNLVKSWSEKEELTGQKVKKERYAGHLSQDAWQVMKEYEYEKIIAQIGKQSGRHGGR